MFSFSSSITCKVYDSLPNKNNLQYNGSIPAASPVHIQIDVELVSW
jgi:hypothetical protein